MVLTSLPPFVFCAVASSLIGFSAHSADACLAGESATGSGVVPTEESRPPCDIEEAGDIEAEAARDGLEI